MTRPDMACALLSALWEPLEDEGLVELRPLAVNSRTAPRNVAQLQHKARRWLPLGRMLEVMPSALDWCARVGFSAYFGVLPRVRAGGRSGDAGEGAAVWADIDLAVVDARKRLERTPFPPSAVVESGRGLHVYWLLSEAHPPLELAALNRRMAVALGSDAAPTHSAALLRLPGSVNPKHAGKPLALLVELERGRRYHAQDLADWLPPLPVRKVLSTGGARAAPSGPLTPEQAQLFGWRRERARKELVKLAARVRATPPGHQKAREEGQSPGRKCAVYAAGASAGVMVARRELTREVAVAALRPAGLASGLCADEVDFHLGRGLDRGQTFACGAE